MPEFSWSVPARAPKLLQQPNQDQQTREVGTEPFFLSYGRFGKQIEMKFSPTKNPKAYNIAWLVLHLLNIPDQSHSTCMARPSHERWQTNHAINLRIYVPSKKVRCLKTYKEMDRPLDYLIQISSTPQNEIVTVCNHSLRCRDEGRIFGWYCEVLVLITLYLQLI